MKNKIAEIANQKTADLQNQKMTRKQAIKKSGLIAVSAATTMILLGSPNKAQAQTSPAPPPPW